VLLVDTGDVSQGSTSSIQTLKDKYIFESYQVIGYDLVNLGMNDLRLGMDKLVSFGTDLSIPWASCNTYRKNVYPELPVEPTPTPPQTPANPGPQMPGGNTPPGSSGGPVRPTPPPSSGNADPTNQAAQGTADSTQTPPAPQLSEEEYKQLPFAPYRIVKKPEAPGFKIGLIGAMVEEGARLNGFIDQCSFEPYEEAIKNSIDELKRQGVDFIVLVCDSDAPDIKTQLSDELQQNINMVIGGRQRPAPSENSVYNPLNERMYNPEMVPPAPPTEEGQTTEQPPQQSNPQTERKSTDEIINGLTPLPAPLFVPKAGARGRLVTRLDLTLNSSGRIVDYQFQEINVSDEYKDDPRMASIAEGFDRDVLTEELVPRVNVKIAGSTACYECHPAFEALWKDTRHFRSYETIAQSTDAGNRDCTRCHAIGFTEEPRLLTYDLIPENLRQVGCEGCHPNGQMHINLQKSLARMTPEQRANATITDSMVGPVLDATCIICHTGEYGVNWNGAAAIEEAMGKCKSVPNPTVMPATPESSPQGATTPGPASPGGSPPPATRR
jgi:hypothetical protein